MRDPTETNRGRERRGRLAWLSFAACLAVTLGFGCVLLLGVVPSVLGVDGDRTLTLGNALLVLAALVAVITALVVLAGTAWLFLARHVLLLSRDDVAEVIFRGPTCSFERRLFDRLFPPRNES